MIQHSLPFLLPILLYIFTLTTATTTTPKNIISYDGRSIIINQTRQLILSGSIHYSRILPSDWEDVFLLAKELHLNTIQTYFFWNFHETTYNNVTWKGRRDLILFIQLAQQYDLYINLRIGPYICGEYYYGGLPLWLRSLDDIKCFRCSDPIWKREMQRVVEYVTTKVRPYLAQNGGNIILLQIENEYNGNGAEDQEYLNWAVEMANNCTAHEQATWSLCHDHTMCTATNIAGHRALCTINGFWMDEYSTNPSQPSPKWMQDQQRNNPYQPLIWTEDQGWFDQWQVGKRVRSSQDQMYGILRFIAYGGSWHNHYMLSGGSNFGLQAGGEVVTSYAPDTVIDSFLLRHEPRFTLYKKMNAVLSSVKVSQALLNTQKVPVAILLPSNASNQSEGGTTAILDSCTDTDPAHVGKLDSSQIWDAIALETTTTGSQYHQLQNRATGLCIDATRSMVHRVSLSNCDNTTNQGLLWRITNGSHVASKTFQKCVSPQAKKGSMCQICLDSNQKEPLGVWDCKNKHTDHQASNQWFHLSNNGSGLRSNRSELCVTAVGSSGISHGVEVHNYDNGLSFISNTDPNHWLMVLPFVSVSNWSIVLAPSSVILANRSTAPPTLLLYTADNYTSKSSTITASPIAATIAKASSWEYYMEPVGIGALSKTSFKGPLEQLFLTKNKVDHMWYSTALPTDTESDSAAVDLSLLQVQGRDGTQLSAIEISNNTIYILASAMGLKNDGGVTPSDGKGISMQGDGPTYNQHTLLDQPWTSSWMISGENLSIFNPVTTNAVKWKTVATNVAVKKASVVWFRAILDTPNVDGVLHSTTDVAYALNLTTMWKGTAYCNGFLLGRYWMVAGVCKGTCAPPIKNGHCYMHWKNCNQPTQTLYHVPTSVLNTNGKNLIVLFEEVNAAPSGASNQKERDVEGVELVVLTSPNDLSPNDLSPNDLSPNELPTTDLSPIGIDGKSKDWVFLIKLGKGGNNCKKIKGKKNFDDNNFKGEDYECGILYADSANQTLRHISGTIHDLNLPLYQSWRNALDPSVAYQVWNDQSGKSNVPPLGPGISAHDKGFLLFNNNSGLLCTHTCPHWLYSSSNRFRDAATFYNTSDPGGDASTYSQTFLLVALKNRTDVNIVRKMIARENAHVFYSNFGKVNKDFFPDYLEPNQPISTQFPTPPLHVMFNSSVILFTKQRNEHYDYWNFFTETFCKEKSMVWTYVLCASGILTSTNITNYNCYARNDRYGQGSEFGVSNWYPNHMKVGYCIENQVVSVAGWNHKKSQLLRGSMFVVIRSKQLHESFSRLFPLNTSILENKFNNIPE